MHEEVPSKFPVAGEISASLVGDAREVPAAMLAVKAEDVRGLGEPVFQMRLPASVVGVTEEEC